MCDADRAPVALVGLPEFSRESLQNAVDRLYDQAVEAIVVAVGRVRAVLRNDTVLRSAWLDLSDAGCGHWRLAPGRPGAYVVRIVTRRTPTLAGSRDTARLRLR